MSEPQPSNRWAHRDDEEYQRMLTKAARLCDVAKSPTAIDTYALDNIATARELLDAAERRLKEVRDDS